MGATLLHKEECYAIQGAIFEVYKTMGCGFLESVYQECLEIEFKLRGIPYFSQPEVEIGCKRSKLEQTYRPDFILYKSIILEIKARKTLGSDHEAQLLNYLKSTNYKVGLLANFGSHPKAQIERRIL